MGNGGMEQQKQSRPPELMEKIVRLLAPPASREHVMGDLSERYRSPGQYLTEALRSLPFIISAAEPCAAFDQGARGRGRHVCFDRPDEQRGASED